MIECLMAAAGVLALIVAFLAGMVYQLKRLDNVDKTPGKR